MQSEPAVVSELRYAPAPHELRTTGLLGFVQCVVAGLLRVDCSLRRTRDGRLVLSFPVKHDEAGRQHALVAPANAAARAAIEQAVFDQLRLDHGAATARAGVQGQSARSAL